MADSSILRRVDAPHRRATGWIAIFRVLYEHRLIWFGWWYCMRSCTNIISLIKIMLSTPSMWCLLTQAYLTDLTVRLFYSFIFKEYYIYKMRQDIDFLFSNQQLLKSEDKFYSGGFYYSSSLLFFYQSLLSSDRGRWSLSLFYWKRERNYFMI